ncbi:MULTISPECIES: DUF6292 family protein [Amycolatopsis]|uniref:DUF6292 family protein n=1 Tax=Amycolatopsis TaxID=1813 RepID=UPI0007DEFCD6|nr:DUF6292 family protein [Amycolatopsis sp. M39]OAP28975.1 hypothetical protein A4R44_00768 [Amycolatopsis sp. M39]
MISTPAPPSEGTAAHLASCRTAHLREHQQHRALAARTVARKARDRDDETLLLSILDLEPGATAPSLESALASYVRQVAEQIGVPLDAVTHEVTDTATAYLGLSSSTAALPRRDLMLVWDERLGWSIAIEPRGNDRPPVIRRLRGHLAPPPGIVAQFVADVLDGRHNEQLSPVPAQLDRAALAAHIDAFPGRLSNTDASARGIRQ